MFKFLFFILSFVFSMKAFAIEPTFKKSCAISNGWTMQLDFYYDGHPHGPGGLHAIIQINDWGVSHVIVTDDRSSLVEGHIRDGGRLSRLQVKASLTDGKFAYRNQNDWLPGGYGDWMHYKMMCN